MGAGGDFPPGEGDFWEGAEFFFENPPPRSQIFFGGEHETIYILPKIPPLLGGGSGIVFFQTPPRDGGGDAGKFNPHVHPLLNKPCILKKKCCIFTVFVVVAKSLIFHSKDPL